MPIKISDLREFSKKVTWVAKVPVPAKCDSWNKRSE